MTDMANWNGKVAIVTGASSGIGEATAEALVGFGVKVVGIARRVERVQQLAERLKDCKGKLYAMECDLRKEEDILKVFRWVEKELGGADILINNAGVLSRHTILESSTETFRQILDVNVLAFAICAREAINSMRKRDVEGHVIVVNSLLGHNTEIEPRSFSLYQASKFAVTAIVGGLRHDLSNVGARIKVSSVSPGLVASEMPQSIGYNDTDIGNYSITVKDVTNAIIYALSTPPDVEVKELMIGTRNKKPSHYVTNFGKK